MSRIHRFEQPDFFERCRVEGPFGIFSGRRGVFQRAPGIAAARPDHFVDAQLLDAMREPLRAVAGVVASHPIKNVDKLCYVK
ncbi:hypothetical protein LJ656_07895 [Paraburkholderia sp. MMS20-SJTR3]|uniref:Uncharacterized protein n=1 Tax=Paraburkholderia sejongensis TaxID=2886946 RepID=A0ABS8JRL9_9BURK|nr:hypothetical protein [Paraburkholderia sp. MMS20-SJTR3]MCC8392508.1 hypothetical protein [Paraburkholderia sp. MMS20-SJTR3]